MVNDTQSRLRYAVLSLLGGLFALHTVTAADTDFDTFPSIRADISSPACSPSECVRINYHAEDVLGIKRLWISCREVTASKIRTHTEEVSKFRLPFVSNTHGTHSLDLSKIGDLRERNILLINVHAAAYRGKGPDVECSLRHPLPLTVTDETELVGKIKKDNETTPPIIDRPIFPFRAKPSQAENQADAELSRVVNARRTDSVKKRGQAHLLTRCLVSRSVC